MRYRVLGPLEVVGEDGVRTIAAAKERQVLGALLAEPNRVVSASRLIDELWGDEPPRSAAKTLQTYVSHLRRIVGDDLETAPSGYLLRVSAQDLDALMFEQLVEQGRQALAGGEARRAARVLGDALALWSGEPLGAGMDQGRVAAEAVRLRAMRVGALEDWFDARLASGDSHELIDGLEAALGEHPLRERLWGLLMVAYYRSGCQADALEAYQRARHVLTEELGIEPGPDLRAIEAAVLAQDLDWAGATPSGGPATHYADAVDGLRIGYASMGEGDVQVLLCAEWVFHLELLWEMLELRPLFERLADGRRLTIVQRRDTGVSDNSLDGNFASPEDCVADIDAVMDTLGIVEAHLVGWGHGGQVALAYAAARPDRARSVAAISGYASLAVTPGNPEGNSEQLLEGWLEMMRGVWGRSSSVEPVFGPRGAKEDLVARVARHNRLIASPRRAVEIQRAVHDFDVGHLLAKVECPVLVVGVADSATGLGCARNLAERLPNAQYLELPGFFIPTAEEVAAIADAVVATFV